MIASFHLLRTRFALASHPLRTRFAPASHPHPTCVKEDP